MTRIALKRKEALNLYFCVEWIHNQTKPFVHRWKLCQNKKMSWNIISSGVTLAILKSLKAWLILQHTWMTSSSSKEILSHVYNRIFAPSMIQCRAKYLAGDAFEFSVSFSKFHEICLMTLLDYRQLLYYLFIFIITSWSV